MASISKPDDTTSVRPMAPSTIDDETIERTRESVVMMQSDEASPMKLEVDATGLLTITGKPATQSWFCPLRLEKHAVNMGSHVV